MSLTINLPFTGYFPSDSESYLFRDNLQRLSDGSIYLAKQNLFQKIGINLYMSVFYDKNDIPSLEKVLECIFDQNISPESLFDKNFGFASNGVNRVNLTNEQINIAFQAYLLNKSISNGVKSKKAAL